MLLCYKWATRELGTFALSLQCPRKAKLDFRLQFLVFTILSITELWWLKQFWHTWLRIYMGNSDRSQSVLVCILIIWSEVWSTNKGWGRLRNTQSKSGSILYLHHLSLIIIFYLHNNINLYFTCHYKSFLQERFLDTKLEFKEYKQFSHRGIESSFRL